MRPPASLLLGLLLFGASMLPLEAEASGARLVVSCAEHDVVQTEMPSEEHPEGVFEEYCAHPEVYFDLGISFGGVAIKMNRPREILAGFDAGMGYGLRWHPTWWTISSALLGIDLFANAGYLARDGQDDAISLGGAVALTIGNLVGIGIGYRHAIGLGQSKDTGDVIMTLGFSTTIPE